MKRIALVLTLLIMITGVVLLQGCDQDPDTPPPAAEMLPDLPGYNQVEGQTITTYISTLAGGAALLAGQPQLTATVAVVDHIIGCYQDVGAVRARVYSQVEQPLAAGAIAIADRNELSDPGNLFQCVLPAALEAIPTGPEGFEVEPCTANYTLTRDDNEFYIIYAGTTPDVCQSFCANLEGCVAHAMNNEQ
jgi:hypothetical protein